ncbi:MAG: hypothetical protein N2C14_18980, partial [Planctomycetales bacterium]
NLMETVKKTKGLKLLQQMLEPSKEINEKYRNHQLLMDDGRIASGVIVKETASEYHVMTNLLAPQAVTKLPKKGVEAKIASKISPMPEGLLNGLTKEEIVNLVSYLEAGGYQPPNHLKKKPQPK